MKIRILSIIGLSIVCVGCSSQSGYYYDRDSGTSVFHSASRSPYEAGNRYLTGQGVPQDSQKAVQLFTQAANDGDPYAQNELAYLYTVGQGTEQNYEKAFYWYQKAADHGLPSAQYNLGLMYRNGIGVPANKQKALELFRSSASQGFGPARKMLVQSYAEPSR